MIEARALSVGYEGVPVIEDLNFKIEKGDYFCIVGENGVGKSTLIKTILNLMSPLAGEIILSSELKQNEIGYLPQQTAVQRDFPASVKEVVLSGCQNRSGFFYSKADKERAMSAMKRMGIDHLANRCYRELSGGQQQRVLLSRALCAASRVLLLDEPVSGLDPKATSEMYALIKELNHKDGITIIMISHDLEGSLSYAKHILHVGRKLFFGTTEEYLASTVGKTFLREEYVR